MANEKWPGSKGNRKEKGEGVSSISPTPRQRGSGGGEEKKEGLD